MAPVELPFLPESSHANTVSNDQFTRKRLRAVLHLITGELKQRGTKTPHIFLPFRSRVNDDKLNAFLQFLFPRGELIYVAAHEDEIKHRINLTDEFTLIAALKYFWSRLPNNEIIGWNVYLEFKRREKEAGYPKSAFLTIMPKCLLSPAHASIVYDFLDLIISIASNSQYNYLSGRKIAKMSSLWAFNHANIKNHRGSAFYDATYNNENNFLQGLDAWKGYLDALFHLILSFLRAMLPDTEKEALRLPKTLQSLLITCSYPPMLNTDSLKASITIPCICVHSTRVSKTPYELLSKVKRTLSFEKKDKFLSIENFTILKNIFQKDSTEEIVDSLTEESRRILNRITQEPIDSQFDLVPGWSRHFSKPDPDIPNYATITIENVTLQDYYIWAWLSTLSSDQSDHMKKLFGRSLVVEAGLRGFQKWLIVTESRMTTEEYLSLFKRIGSPTLELIGPPPPVTKDGRKSKEKKRIKISSRKPKALTSESYKKKSMPPLPADSGFLPQYNFDEEDSKIDLSFTSSLDDSNNSDSASSPLAANHSDFKDYRAYLDNLSDDTSDSILTKSKNSSPTAVRHGRRKPPPLSIIGPSPSSTSPLQLQSTKLGEPDAHDQVPTRTDVVRPEATSHLAPNPEKGSSVYRSPDMMSSSTQFYSPEKHANTRDYQEPFDSYKVPYEKPVARKLPPEEEPFESYHVMGLDQKVESTSSVSDVDDSEMNNKNEQNSGAPGQRLSQLPSPTVDQFSPELEEQTYPDQQNIEETSPDASPKKKSKKKSKNKYGFDLSNLPPGPPPPLNIPLAENAADGTTYMSPPVVPQASFFPSSPVLSAEKKHAQGLSSIPQLLPKTSSPSMEQMKRFTTDDFQMHVPSDVNSPVLSGHKGNLGSAHSSAEKLPPSMSKIHISGSLQSMANDTRNVATRYSRDRDLPATPRDSVSDSRSSNAYSKGQSPNDLSLRNGSPSSLSTIPASAQKSPTEKTDIRANGFPPQPSGPTAKQYSPQYANNGYPHPAPSLNGSKELLHAQQPAQTPTAHPTNPSPPKSSEPAPPRHPNATAPMYPGHAVAPGTIPAPASAPAYPAYPANYPYQQYPQYPGYPPQQYAPQYSHPPQQQVPAPGPQQQRKSAQQVPPVGSGARGSHQRISQASDTSGTSSKHSTPTIHQQPQNPVQQPQNPQAATAPHPQMPHAGQIPPPAAHGAPAPGYPPYYYYPLPPAGYPPYNPNQTAAQPYGYPPPPQQYPYPYPPYGYPPYGYPPQPPAAAKDEKVDKLRPSEMSMNGIPNAGRHNKNTPINRVGLRHALQKDFGI